VIAHTALVARIPFPNDETLSRGRNAVSAESPANCPARDQEAGL